MDDDDEEEEEEEEEEDDDDDNDHDDDDNDDDKTNEKYQICPVRKKVRKAIQGVFWRINFVRKL